MSLWDASIYGCDVWEESNSNTALKLAVSFPLSVLPVNLLKCIKKWIHAQSSCLLLGLRNSRTFCIPSAFIIEEVLEWKIDFMVIKTKERAHPLIIVDL